MFDPNTFMDATFTESNSTVAVPVPAREYPTALIEDAKITPWQGKKDPSLSGMKLQIVWEIDDDAVRQELDRSKVTVRQEIMLDLNDAGTGLDMGKGKNVSLGRLREAVGLNSPGQPFSFAMLKGRVARIVVSHRQNPENPEQIFAEVKSVAKP